MIKSLLIIERQSYPKIEIIISDDNSTDNTKNRIEELQQSYKYPIVYYRFPTNMGYDRNLRKSLELATGTYCFVLGNDDSIYGDGSIQFLVEFLIKNNYPDLGYCNYIEYVGNSLNKRASQTGIQGSGIDCAVKHANSFSFVGGIIYKKSSFDTYNTDRHDGSIYTQMYLGLLMIASGCILFTIAEPIVIKDIKISENQQLQETYKNSLPKKWSEYRVMDGGMHSVTFVLISAIEDAHKKEVPFYASKVLERIYKITYLYWIVNYKKFGSLAAAVGLIHGMFPSKSKIWNKLKYPNRLSIFLIYVCNSAIGILIPYRLFTLLEPQLRKLSRKLFT